MNKSFLGEEKTSEEILSLIDDLAKNKKVKKLLESLVDDLPVRERQVVSLRFWGNMNYYQISSCLNMRVTTVEKVLFSALKRLKMKKRLILKTHEKGGKRV